MTERAITPANVPQTYAELRRAVEGALLAGQRAIERAKVRTYWETGRLIDAHLFLFKERADYGVQVIPRLGRDLDISDRVLYYCLKFARLYPILPARAELTWGHYRALTHVENPAERKTLEREAERNHWTTGDLESRVARLNAAADAATALPAGVDGATSRPASPLLIPQCGTPGLHLIVDRGGGPVVDLGFKLYRGLGTNSKLAAGAIVRIAGDGSLRRADDATQAELFTYAATLRRVVDGDTLVVALEVAPEIFVEEKLRLRGLDCPELSTPEGKAAKRFVDALVAQTTAVVIHTTKPDKYDRYLADVFLAGPSDQPSVASAKEGTVFLNNALLENGHAGRKDAWEFRDWEPDLIGWAAARRENASPGGGPV